MSWSTAQEYLTDKKYFITANPKCGSKWFKKGFDATSYRNDTSSVEETENTTTESDEARKISVILSDPLSYL